MKIIKVTHGVITLTKLSGRDWELDKPLKITIQTKSSGRLIFDIKSGFKTDLGSVPKRVQGIVGNGSNNEGALIAYVLHDVLYRTNYIAKKTADKFLLHMLKGHLQDRWDRYLAYWSVKFCGHAAYEHTNEELRDARKFVKFDWTS